MDVLKLFRSVNLVDVFLKMNKVSPSFQGKPSMVHFFFASDKNWNFQVKTRISIKLISAMVSVIASQHLDFSDETGDGINELYSLYCIMKYVSIWETCIIQ